MTVRVESELWSVRRMENDDNLTSTLEGMLCETRMLTTIQRARLDSNYSQEELSQEQKKILVPSNLGKYVSPVSSRGINCIYSLSMEENEITYHWYWNISFHNTASGRHTFSDNVTRTMDLIDLVTIILSGNNYFSRCDYRCHRNISLYRPTIIVMSP